MLLQSGEIIFTDSTWSFCWLPIDDDPYDDVPEVLPAVPEAELPVVPEVVLPLLLELESRRPVTSILCPACFASSSDLPTST